MCRKSCAPRKKPPTPMMIQRVNGVIGALRSSIRASVLEPVREISLRSPTCHTREGGYPEYLDFPGFRVALAIASLPGMTQILFNELQKHHITDRRRKSSPTLLVQRLLAGHTGSRSASCPCATCETAPCDGSGCPAYGRKQPRLPALDVAAPKTSPCPRSSGSGRQACDARLQSSLVHARPNVSKGEWPARSCGMEPGIL